jgi:maltooligosyltrehalose synthase
MAPEGTHAARAVAFRRGVGSGARITLVARLTGGLGGGTPIGARWDDTRLRMDGESGGTWRCLLSGVEVSVHDGALAFAAALAELPVALLAPTKVV